MTTDVLLPWIHAAGGDGERKSMQAFHGDGTTGPWSFTFAGGYIDRAHVKAYRYDPVSATAHPQTLTFLGANQIKTTDPIPAGQYIVIYRDTPKDKPLVDYNEGAVLTEKNLDTTAEQAVFAAAEMVDRFDTINTTSNEAIERSVLALDTANAALSNSNTAMADAADAVTTANAASTTAEQAVATANQAAAVAAGIDDKAQHALSTSIAAADTANAAVETANDASTTANGIDAKATQAQTDAAAAVITANTAASSVAGALAGKANAAHTHPWGDITNKPATSTRWPTWGEVTGKPASFGAPIHSITALPTSNVGPIIVAEASEVWVWVSTAHYTGYRSPLCGRPVDGHTLLPLAHEIDAVGGLLSKTAYAGLWGYAQENELLVTQTAWSANIGAHWFVDASATQFRAPDLRNQFRRYAGTNADDANTRPFGSKQLGGVRAPANWGFARYAIGRESTTAVDEFNTSGELAIASTNGPALFSGGAETRPTNTAYHPRIHI